MEENHNYICFLNVLEIDDGCGVAFSLPHIYDQYPYA